MAITAWSAKVLSSAICLSVNGPAVRCRTMIAPIGRALPQHRHAEDARAAAGARAPPRRAVLADRPQRPRCGRRRASRIARPVACSRRRRQREYALRTTSTPSRRVAVGDDECDQLAVEPEHDAPMSAPHSRAALLDDGVEDRLDVGRRAGDDAQDLARRRLLLQRLGEIAVALLELREQARRSRWRSPPGRRRSRSARSACRVNGRTSRGGSRSRRARSLAQHRDGQRCVRTAAPSARPVRGTRRRLRVRDVDVRRSDRAARRRDPGPA